MPETVVFDSFRGGEFGQRGASGAHADSFTGRNVMVFQDGAIGPRPGLKEISPSGMVQGTVWGFVGLGRSATRGVIFGVGNTVYGFTYDPLGAVTPLGTLSGGTPSVTPVQLVQHGNLAYLVVKGDKGYKVDPSIPSVTALTQFPGARVLGVYGERMIAANTNANPNRVYYSAAADFATWPALNYFDVGAVQGISHVSEARNRLAIANAGNEWWALSGVPGVNDTLRRAPRSDLSPFEHNHVSRLGESLWFMPCLEDFPAQFTGAVTDKLRYRYLAFADGAGVTAANGGAAALAASETLVFTQGTAGKMLVLHNDVWSVHTIPVGIGPLVVPVGDQGVGVTNAVLLLCDGGGVGVAAKFYVWKPTLDRPGKVGDAEAQPGDASTTPLTANLYLPEWWARDGREALVRSVTVDFAKWNTGSSATNHFDLTVRALHRTGIASHKDSTVQRFDEAASLTTTDRQPDRQVFPFGDQGSAHGFQLRFDALRGVAIRRVSVQLELTDARRP
jgi:hypothetical protein